MGGVRICIIFSPTKHDMVTTGESSQHALPRSLCYERRSQSTEKVKHAMEKDGKSDNYTAQERAKIGKHAAENRPARAV